MEIYGYVGDKDTEDFKGGDMFELRGFIRGTSEVVIQSEVEKNIFIVSPDDWENDFAYYETE